MKVTDISKEHFSVREMSNRHSSQLIKKILEYRASEKDTMLTNQLLKTLVINYADAEKKLVELNQLKNKFLGIAAHDLRNPLTSIRGFSEIIMNEEMGPLTDEQKEFMGIIYSTSEEMLRLVNDLLDVSVIESGKLELQIKKDSIKSVLEDRLRITEFIAVKKDISFKADLADVPDISFDPNRIAQVFDNLVSNAIKFSPQGSVVYITLQRKNDRVRISVRDEGPGISEEDKAKLFGDFQRLSARPTGGEKSTGLGLAIVKKIIDAHNGTLDVESQPGKGATFSFELPSEG